MQTRRAIVVGGSMAGLFAANFLHRAGWQVDVLERASSPLNSRGAGIVTHKGMLALLDLAGVDTAQPVGLPMSKRLSLDRTGEITAEVDFPQMMLGWSRLYAMLMDALPMARYHLDHAVQTLSLGDSQTPARVVCQNGSVWDADVVIGADGVRSTVRTYFHDREVLEVAPYVAWRALVPLADLSTAAQDFHRNSFVVVNAPSEELVTYPVLGDDAEIYINLVWYRGLTPAQQVDLFTDAQGQYHSQGISPLAIRLEHLRDLKVQACALFHPWLAEVVEAAPALMLQQIGDQQSTSMVKGRVALLGDAAFVARPHVGQGVTKAGGDAWVLNQCLGAHAQISDALTAFEQARLHVGHHAVEKARQLGALIGVHSHEAEAMQPWVEHYSNPQVLLQDTAVELPGLAGLEALDE